MLKAHPGAPRAPLRTLALSDLEMAEADLVSVVAALPPGGFEELTLSSSSSCGKEIFRALRAAPFERCGGDAPLASGLRHIRLNLPAKSG